MKFFKIWGNIILFCCFVFLLFFSGPYFQAIARPIYTKFGTNVCFCLGFRKHVINLEKVKKQVTTSKKNLEKSLKFQGYLHVFAQCDETVKDF